jgi:hypothetical protein
MVKNELQKKLNQDLSAYRQAHANLTTGAAAATGAE